MHLNPVDAHTHITTNHQLITHLPVIPLPNRDFESEEEHYLRFLIEKDMVFPFMLTCLFIFAGTTTLDMLIPLMYSQCVLLAFLMLILLRAHQRFQAYHSLTVIHTCFLQTSNQLETSRGKKLDVLVTCMGTHHTEPVRSH